MSFGSRSLAPPTEWESERIRVCKACGCVACRYNGNWAIVPPVEYHHLLVGGLRVGHRYGVALCAYHHRGIRRPGQTEAEMRLRVGPNLHDHKREFRAANGTDQVLLDRQDELIGYLKTTIPSRPERKRKSRCTASAKQVKRPTGGFAP